MEEETLQNLMVYLHGDASGFEKMLEDVSEKATHFANDVTATLSSVAQIAGISESLHDWFNLEKTQVRLSAAIKAAGGDVASATEEYDNLARSLERVTGASEGSIKALEAQALQMGLNIEQAKTAVRLALGAQQARGIPASGVLGALTMWMKTGNWRGMSMLMPELRRGPGMGGGHGGEGGAGMSDAERNAMITKRLNDYWETAIELSDTLSGQYDRLKASFTDFRENLGKIVGEYAKPFVKWLNDVVQWLKDLNPAILKVAVGVGLVITAMTTAGPVMRLLRLVGGIVVNLNATSILIGSIITAAVAWVAQMGSVEKAWETIRTRIVEAGRAALGWIQTFIYENQRLTLAVGLIAGTVLTVVAAWRTLVAALGLVNAILTVTHIKQTVQYISLLAWRGAVMAVHAAAAVLGTFLAGAQWLGSILLGTAAVVAQTAVWILWRATVVAAYLAMLAFPTLFTTIRAGLLAIRGAVTLAGIGMAVLQAGFALVAGTMATFYAAGVAVKTVLDILRAGFTLGYETVMGTIQIFKALGVVMGTVSILEETFAGLLMGVVAAGYGIATGAVWLYNLALTATAVLESIATFGLNLLAGVLALVALVALGGVGAWLAWQGAVLVVTATAAAAASAVSAMTASLVAAATVGWMVPILLAAGAFVAAFFAAKVAVKGFLDTLLAIPGRTGVLASVGGMFSEWFGYIKNIIAALGVGKLAIDQVKGSLAEVSDELKGISTGTDLAWKLFTQAFHIAVREVQLAWPALWSFITSTTTSAWEVLKAGWRSFTASLTPPFLLAWTSLVLEMKASLLEALHSLLKDMREAVGHGTLANWLGINKDLSNAVQTLEDRMANARLKALVFKDKPIYAGMKEDIQAAEQAMTELNEQIKKQSDTIAAAALKAGKDVNAALANDETLKAMKQRFAMLQKFSAAAVEQQKANEDAFPKPIERANKELEKLEGHLRGSAEAVAAYHEYIDKLMEQREKQEAKEGGAEGGGAEGARPVPTPLPTRAEEKTVGDKSDAVVVAIKWLGGVVASDLPRHLTNGNAAGAKPKAARLDAI